MITPLSTSPQRIWANFPDWEDEAVTQLAESWQEASPIFDDAAALAHWVDQNSDERLAQAVSLLLDAHQVITQPA